jgi:hypothetical protein
VEGENSTSGPQPYQPYKAKVTNSPISNNENGEATCSEESSFNVTLVYASGNEAHIWTETQVYY